MRVDSTDIQLRWVQRRDEFRKLRATVDGALLCEEILADLTALDRSEPTVSLRVAAEQTGYSPGHLSRLIHKGLLANYGRKHSPRVRVSECPNKPLANRRRSTYDAVTDARSLV